MQQRARLEEAMRAIERAARPQAGRSVPVGVPGLEALLPEGRLAAGVLVELLGDQPGSGLWSVALALAAGAGHEGRGLLLVDVQRQFYPPAAVVWGLDLQRMLVVRPPTVRAGLSALAEGLRCPALGLAVGWFEQISRTDSRRLQLAAESGGGVGVLLRPRAAQRERSFAAVRLRVVALPSQGTVRRLAVEALHWRAGLSGRRLTVEIHDETYPVRASASVAPAAGEACPASRTG